jgi:uncharacterized protein
MKFQPKLALITGASHGIGTEFARILASQKVSLILTGRDEKALISLKKELDTLYGIQSWIYAADLSLSEQVQSLINYTQSQGLEVDFLINNAGFGHNQLFADSDSQIQLDMIDVNIKALTLLTHHYIQNMTQKGEGRILQVASTAAFQPGPGMAVYYASKAFVLRFSEALNFELGKKSNVRVTALCPGPTESEFFKTAGLTKSNLSTKMKLPTAREVAQKGIDAALKGKAVVIHGLMNAFFARTVNIYPRTWVLKAIQWLHGY